MSPWNRDALVSLRETLQLRVQVEAGLCTRLEEAAGGFMTEFEAATVRVQSGNIKQMGKLVEILCSKDDKHFSTFLQMLRDSKNNWLANKLERKAEELKREKGVCAERKEATQRYSAQCLQCNRGPCTWYSTASLQRCTALLHFERLIDLMCFHVLMYVHTYLPTCM